MRSFFRFIRNIFLLALLAFGVWTYKNNPNVQMATQESLATLSYRINQLLTTGTATAPKNSEVKTDTDKLKMIILPITAFSLSQKLMFMLTSKTICN